MLLLLYCQNGVVLNISPAPHWREYRILRLSEFEILFPEKWLVILEIITSSNIDRVNSLTDNVSFGLR